MLVTLGLVVQLLCSQPGVPAWASYWGIGVLAAAIFIPAGFFLSVIGRDPQRPNGLKALIWLGALSLTVGLAVAGAGLIIAGLG